MTRSLFLKNYESLILIVAVSLIFNTSAKNLTKEICRLAVQEALSMGLSFPQPEKLPIILNPTTQSEQRHQPNTENRQLSRNNDRTSSTTTSTTIDENSRNAKESLYLWLSETQLNQLLEYNFLDTYRAHAGQGRSLSDLTWDANHSQLYHQSLCYWSDTNLPKHTCCTFQMELGLLQKTTEELHQSLSTYLERWHKELAKLRTALRDQLIESLELLKIQLNQTFCSYEFIINNNSNENSTNYTWNCWYHIMELISKFRLILEQSFLTQDDIILDLMFPVDNYLMQSLLETSCQTYMTDSKNIQAEELDEKIKCHEYCQARLNLIFDSLTGHSDLPSLTRKSRNLFVNKVNRHSLLQLTNNEKNLIKNEEKRISKSRNIKSSNHINNYNTDNDMNQMNNFLIEAEQYRMLYRPELVFTFRLNRKLIQSLELGESLIDGLKNFNIAQGTCMRKLMRMHYCALCAGETLTRPCPELCLKILLDCLRPLSQLNPQWYRFTETIKSVADIFLGKPQLRLESQLDDFPEHLVNYYHQLLHTYHNWLQPQCSGIKKLYNVFDQLKNNSKTIFQTIKSNNTKRLKQHKKIFEQMKTTMDEITNIWSRSSTALCLESPYLALLNGRRDQCWNGTAISSFHEEDCTFCQHEPKLQETIVTSSQNENYNEKLSPSRKQRTSFIPTNDVQQSSVSETDDLLSASIASTNYLLNNPSWNSPLQHDKELAFRRANEILVRASRDLEWSVKSLLAETNYYNSLNAKSTSNGSGKSKGNTPSESWARISASQKPGVSEQYETGKTSSNSHSDMTNSLGMLAYGSILNWNSQGVGEEEDEEVQRKMPMNSKSNNPSSSDSSSKPIQMTTNQGNSRKKNSPDRKQQTRPLDRNSNLGSGFFPGWTLYAWTPISSPTKEHTYGKPVDNSLIQEEINYDESGLHDSKGELDYPQMFPFINMNSQGLNISIMGSDEKFLRNNSLFNPNYHQNLNNSLWTNKQNTENNNDIINLTNLNKSQESNSNKNVAVCINLQRKQYTIINISISVMLLIYLLGI
ncbi:unnamed protein product [Schistosoma spindalis]|nr:unnamed protein product [Schistosoma spindale]